MLQSQGVEGQDATSPSKAPNTAVTPVKYHSQAAVVVSCRVITTAADLANNDALENAAGQGRSSLVVGCSLQRLRQADEELLSTSEQCSDTTSETSSGSWAVSANAMYTSAPEDEGAVESVSSSGENDRRFPGEAARFSITGASDEEDYEYSRSEYPPAGGVGQRENNEHFQEAIENIDIGECDRAGSSRCLSNVRALSSKCLEGLAVGWREARGCEDGKKRDWRDRSASNPRIPEPSSPRTDFVDVSGEPSEQEHPSGHNRQYSCEASNPPPQVLQGFNLDSVKLDRRSWLEVRDEHHRYGKNLRLYFKEWDRQGRPGGSFFKWLSTPEVQLEGCPRHELESDVVHYCRPEERENYALRLAVTPEGRAMLHTAKGKPVNSGSKAWLFVLRDRTIFATDKKTDPPRFHHSSFFGGECVEAAGMLVAENGVLVVLYPHSGHYRPTNSHLQRLLRFLRGLGVDLSVIQVDAQRVHKVARPDKRAEQRVRKMDNPFMMSGQKLLDFFDIKHKAWASSLFVNVCRKAREREARIHGEDVDSSWEDGAGGEGARGAAGGVEGVGLGAGGGDAATVYGACVSGGGSVSIDSGGGLGMGYDSCGEE